MSWYGLRRFIRSGKSSAFLILGLTIATAMFVGPSIASDTALAGGLIQVLESTPAHMSLYTTVEHFLTVSQLRQVAEDVATINGVADVEIVAHRFTYYSTFFAINNDSIFYHEMTIETGPTWIGENETYIVSESPSLNQYPPGSQVELPFTYRNDSGDYLHYLINLTVVGQVSLPPALRKNALMDFSIELLPEVDIWEHKVDLYLLNWDATMAPLIDYFSPRVPNFLTGTRILISVNIPAVINPFDLTVTETRMDSMQADIESAAEWSNMTFDNWISEGLEMLYWDVSTFTTHIVLSVLPAMLVSLYLCKVLGDVSVRQRSREIRLLLSRGVFPARIRNATIFETLLLVAIAGSLGLLLAVVSVNLVVNIPQPIVTPRVDLLTVMTAFSFAAIACGISVILPMRRSILQQSEDTDSDRQAPRSGWRRLLIWILFLAGTYRVISWWIGFSPQQLAEGVTNVMALIFYNSWIFWHDLLTWVAPLLFLYGLSKLVTEELPSIKSAIATSAGKLFGDIGHLAARHSGRRISQTAAIVFILSLITSYGIWSIGVSASYQEHFVRTSYIEVGADMRIYLDSEVNMSNWTSTISELPEIYSATPEIGVNVMTEAGSALIYGIDPFMWGSVAFFEEHWFRQTLSDEALAEMSSDNLTIVLEQRLASQLDVSVGDVVSIELPGTMEKLELRVVGFFLRALPYNVPGSQIVEPSWSLVPLDLFEQLNSSVEVRNHLIARLMPNVDGLLVEDAVFNLSPEILGVRSAASVVASFSESLLLKAPRDVALLTAGFGVLLASLGVFSVINLALKERERDLRILSLRGYSSSLLIKILVVEVIGILAFSLLMALFVGFAWLVGSVNALNNPMWLALSMQIVGYQVVIRPEDWLWLGLLLSMMIISVISPSVYAAYRAQRNLERLGEEEWL